MPITANFPANMQKCHHVAYFNSHFNECIKFAFKGTGVAAPTETPTAPAHTAPAPAHTAPAPAPAHTTPAPAPKTVVVTTSPLAKAIAAKAATAGVKVVKG